MDRAGVETAITDPYRDPLLDARAALGRRLAHLKVMGLAAYGEPVIVDAQGNQRLWAKELAEQTAKEANDVAALQAAAGAAAAPAIVSVIASLLPTVS